MPETKNPDLVLDEEQCFESIANSFNTIIDASHGCVCSTIDGACADADHTACFDGFLQRAFS
jgi:hypothetical protein